MIKMADSSRKNRHDLFASLLEFYMTYEDFPQHVQNLTDLVNLELQNYENLQKFQNQHANICEDIYLRVEEILEKITQYAEALDKINSNLLEIRSAVFNNNTDY